MTCADAIERLAGRLPSDGYLDNEADARLAAVYLILASEGCDRDVLSEDDAADAP